ncbi:MAG: heparinase II/III family protein, partial [Bacteroidota bacterium]
MKRLAVSLAIKAKLKRHEGLFLSLDPTRIDIDEVAVEFFSVIGKRTFLFAEDIVRETGPFTPFAERNAISVRDVLVGNFSFLGLHNEKIDQMGAWNVDWRSHKAWPQQLYPFLLPIETNLLGSGPPFKDIKIPWELSLFQHLVPLAQQYVLTNDESLVVEIVRQLEDWIDSNTYLYGIHWTVAMEVALRSIAWLTILGWTAHSPSYTKQFRRKIVISLLQHAEFVISHLEKYTEGRRSNHLIADYAGLLFLGCAFRGMMTDAEMWYSLGRGGLCEEMAIQVDKDGVCFESSIPYHRLVTEMFLFSQLLAR